MRRFSFSFEKWQERNSCKLCIRCFTVCTEFIWSVKEKEHILFPVSKTIIWHSHYTQFESVGRSCSWICRLHRTATQFRYVTMFSANFTLSDTVRICAWARTDGRRKGRSQRGEWRQRKRKRRGKRKRMIRSRIMKEKNEKMEEEERAEMKAEETRRKQRKRRS